MKNENSPKSIDKHHIENKKTTPSKFMNALLIGLLAGVVIFGVVASIITQKFIGLIPLLFPVYFIYRLTKSPKKSES